MPRRRRLPFAFGIIRSLTGRGLKRRALRSSRSPASRPSPNTIELGCTPSTPADRAPRLPRTRCHATTRKAGSATRLNKSQNRRSGLSVAHWCNFACIRSTRGQASERSGHGSSVFTGGLLPLPWRYCSLAGSLRHVRGFPTLGLLRTLRPTSGPTADSGPARRRTGCATGWAIPRWFPRFTMNRSTGLVPSSSPAASPRVRRRLSSWPPRRPRYSDFGVAVSFPSRRALLSGPHPTGWSRGYPLKGVQPLVHFRCTFPSCLSDPDHL